MVCCDFLLIIHVQVQTEAEDMTKKKNVSQEYFDARHAISIKSPERISILKSLKDINEQDKDN
jgi:hypothetical protein